MATEPELDPQSLLARMIAELRANPEVRVLLLRALLTDEFLEMPARMIRVEDDIVQIKFDVSQLQADVSQLQADVSQLQADVSQLQADVSQLKIDVAELKGTNLEIKSVQRIQSIITQRLELRRPRTVHSLTAPMSGNPLDALQDAEELGRIRPGGDSEVLEADLIFSARRRADGEPVWVVAEVSNTVDQHDVSRAQVRSAILGDAYSQTAFGVVAGRSIRSEEEQMADDLGVNVVML